MFTRGRSVRFSSGLGAGRQWRLPLMCAMNADVWCRVCSLAAPPKPSTLFHSVLMPSSDSGMMKDPSVSSKQMSATEPPRENFGRHPRGLGGSPSEDGSLPSESQSGMSLSPPLPSLCSSRPCSSRLLQLSAQSRSRPPPPTSTSTKCAVRRAFVGLILACDDQRLRD